MVGMKPNKYDLSFLDWWRHNGWLLCTDFGRLSVVAHDDRKCPFKVTLGMVKRLEDAGLLEQIFPPDMSVWEKRYIPTPK